jgi:hypothetical protein
MYAEIAAVYFGSLAANQAILKRDRQQAENQHD